MLVPALHYRSTYVWNIRLHADLAAEMQAFPTDDASFETVAEFDVVVRIETSAGAIGDVHARLDAGFDVRLDRQLDNSHTRRSPSRARSYLSESGLHDWAELRKGPVHGLTPFYGEPEPLEQ